MVEVTLIATTDQGKIRSSPQKVNPKRDHVIGGWNADLVKLNFPFLTLINTLASAPHSLSNHGPLWIDSCCW